MQVIMHVQEWPQLQDATSEYAPDLLGFSYMQPTLDRFVQVTEPFLVFLHSHYRCGAVPDQSEQVSNSSVLGTLGEEQSRSHLPAELRSVPKG